MSPLLLRAARQSIEELDGFDRVEPRVIDAWLAAGQFRRFPRDQTICAASEASPGIQLLLEGVALTGLDLRAPDAFVMTLLGPGDTWGIVPLFHRQQTVLDVVAYEDCVVFDVPVATIEASFEDSRQCMRALAGQVAHRTGLLLQRFRDCATLPVPARLARVINRLGEGFGREHDGHLHIPLRITQTLLSQMAGASRQQVNVALGRLEAQGVLRVGRESITIVDPVTMKSLGAGVPLPTLRRPRRAMGNADG